MPKDLLYQEIKTNPMYKSAVVMNGLISFMTASLQAYFIARTADNLLIRHLSVYESRVFLAGALLVILLRPLWQYFFELYVSITAGGIRRNLQGRLAAALLQDAALTTDEHAGDDAVLMAEIPDAVEPYYEDFLPLLGVTLVSVPLLAITAAIVDWVSGLIMAVTILLFPLFIILINSSTLKRNTERWDTLQRLGGSFLDALNGLKTLKIFGRSRDYTETLYRYSEAFRVKTMQVLKISFLSAFVLELTASLSIAVLAVALGLRLLYGQMEFFPAFWILLLAPEYYQPIRQLGGKFHDAIAAWAAAEQIYSRLETCPATVVKPGDESPAPSVGAVGLQIECRDLCFSYPYASRPALDHFSLTIRPRQITAVAGSSGAGKSTLAAALLKFIQPEAGEILFNGQNIASMDTDTLRSMIAYIPQKPFIFHDTLLNNLRLARPEATAEEAAAAAGQAGLAELIASLPQGLMTVLAEDGADLSQGEAQRVNLARAILKDAPLIIVDEGTSAQDTANEARLLAALQALSRNHTVLLLSHRLATVKSAAWIGVMEAGRLAEQGSHTELLENGPLYREFLQAGRENDAFA
ncbi:MAG TPA: thiol reductant ABC exporter subunit CydD [Syntrophomonas sp.]|nr:thiol reductant ABC exporter subunit CydD [Syntrophomonas sp.]